MAGFVAGKKVAALAAGTPTPIRSTLFPVAIEGAAGTVKADVSKITTDIIAGLTFCNTQADSLRCTSLIQPALPAEAATPVSSTILAVAHGSAARAIETDLSVIAADIIAEFTVCHAQTLALGIALCVGTTFAAASAASIISTDFSVTNGSTALFFETDQSIFAASIAAWSAAHDTHALAL